MMKSKLIIILGVIILILLILAPRMVPTVWTQGSTSDWILFYGSYLGAILGGLVAFAVARIQVKALENQEKNRRIIQQLPALIQLKFEVEKAKKFMGDKKKLADNKDRINLTGINLTMSTHHPNVINKELWYQMDKIEDAELMADIVRFRESYFELRDTLAIDIWLLESEIKEKIREIEGLGEESDPQSQKKKNQMIIELRDLRLILEPAKDNKLKEWQKIEDGSYLGEVTKIEEKLNSTIEGIEKIKAEKN